MARRIAVRLDQGEVPELARGKPRAVAAVRGAMMAGIAGVELLLAWRHVVVASEYL